MEFKKRYSIGPTQSQKKVSGRLLKVEATNALRV